MTAITAICKRANIARPIWLMPILESALGIENAFAIATASNAHCSSHHRLGGLHRRSWRGENARRDRKLYMHAAGGECRPRCACAGYRFGVRRRGDTDGLLHWGESSRAMGFEGMGCIHPMQIEIIHRAFAPTASELDKALKIVAAYRGRASPADSEWSVSAPR